MGSDPVPCVVPSCPYPGGDSLPLFSGPLAAPFALRFALTPLRLFFFRNVPLLSSNSLFRGVLFDGIPNFHLALRILCFFLSRNSPTFPWLFSSPVFSWSLLPYKIRPFRRRCVALPFRAGGPALRFVWKDLVLPPS